MFKVIVVEDQELTAEGHARNLTAPDFMVVAIYHARNELRRSSLLETAHLLLLDLKLPDERDSTNPIGACVPTINLVEDLNKAYPNLVIVLLTNEETPYFVHLSKLAGARGYILKSQIGLANSFSETLLSILTEGKRIFPETFAPTQIAEISAAELRVVVTKCEHPGKSSTVIGEMLGLEDSTVRNHLSSVYKKLGVKGLVEAKLRLMESNLISE